MTFPTIYRPDIDGLRAIAVLGVVLFHAGVPGISGGYVGVDVFFVISGYLITNILLRDLNLENYSIAHFYVRRARRILPALFVVLVATFLLGWFWLLPLEYKQLSSQALSVLFFISNWIFWRQSGYFDTAAELKPLLHTWSLAVEEQFYLFWPLILWLVFYKTHRLKLIFWIMISISFLISCYLVIFKPNAGFFLIQSRAWELFIGAGLIVYNDLPKRLINYRNSISTTGLMLILLSYVFLNKSSTFPAWNAIWPCLGTALLISAGPSASVNRLLQLPWLVTIGLMSYSLYLWHWPLLTFIRIVHFGELPLNKALVAVVISFFLARLTWQFVEQPFRRGNPTESNRLILTRYTLGLCLITLLALAVKMGDGIQSRMPQRVVDAQLAAKDVNQAREKCHLGLDQADLPIAEECITGNTNNVEVLVWGDSHAEALTPGFSQTKVMTGLGIRQTTKTSCPPLLGVSIIRGTQSYNNCVEFNQAVFEYLAQTPKIKTVILSARWPVYVNESGFGIPEIISQAPKHKLQTLANNEKISLTGEQAFAHSLKITIGKLKQLNKQVVVIGSVPEMQVDIPSCLARKRLYNQPESECGLDTVQVQERLSATDHWISQAANNLNIKAYFPSDVFCSKTCIVIDDIDQILYYDHNHLSAKGSTVLLNRFLIGINK